MNTTWKVLPRDLLHHILEYDGRIKYRNEKYINRICKTDERYKLLHRIPGKLIHSHLYYPDIWFISVYFDNWYYHLEFSIGKDFAQYKFTCNFESNNEEEKQYFITKCM